MPDNVSGNISVEVKLTGEGGRPTPPGGVPGGMPIPPGVAPSEFFPKGFESLTKIQKENMAYTKEVQRLQKEKQAFDEQGRGPVAKGITSMMGTMGKFLPFLGAAGIAGSLIALVRSSKIAQTTFSSVSSILGAMTDLILLPLVPLIAEGLKNFAALLPWVQKLVQEPMETAQEIGKKALVEVGRGEPIKEPFKWGAVLLGEAGKAVEETKDYRETMEKIAKEGGNLREYYYSMFKIGEAAVKAPIQAAQNILDAFRFEQATKPIPVGEQIEQWTKFGLKWITEQILPGKQFEDLLSPSGRKEKWEREERGTLEKHDIVNNITVNVTSTNPNIEDTRIKVREGVFMSLDAYYGLGNYGAGRE